MNSFKDAFAFNVFFFIWAKSHETVQEKNWKCYKMLNPRIFQLPTQFQGRFFKSAFLWNFFLCQDRLSSDVPPHLAQPCYVALGRALIWGLYINFFLFSYFNLLVINIKQNRNEKKILPFKFFFAKLFSKLLSKWWGRQKIKLVFVIFVCLFYFFACCLGGNGKTLFSQDI